VSILNTLLTLFIILISGGLLFWIIQWLEDEQEVSLRSHEGYRALRDQIVGIVEGGQKIHYTLGRGSLAAATNPTSIAALNALDFLESQVVDAEGPPLVTVGDGTLLVSAQDTKRALVTQEVDPDEFFQDNIRFIAADSQPMAFAGGVSDIVNQADIGSNLMLGRLGTEVAIIGEAAIRQDLEQVVGSDDLVALGLAAPLTNNLLIGEELLAAGAYLQGKPAQIASLQVQDMLRVLAVVGIVLAALINAIVG
jgi:hypothetical protein